MATVFEKLRMAREGKGIALEDIAIATRIQTKILQALETGNVTGIPPVYVRAFLRAYAKEVGVKEEEVLHEYEKHCRGLNLHAEEERRPKLQEVRRESGETSNLPKPLQQVWRVISQGSQYNITLLLGGMLIILLILTLSFFNEEKPIEGIEELYPTVQQRTTLHIDTLQRQPSSESEPAQRTAEPAPPLILRAMTFDSVWIRVVIDGKVQREYRAPPRWSMQWRAQHQFLVSVDNAGVVTFVLNNVSLGMIGEAGKPVVNYLIRRPGDSPYQPLPPQP